uniref:Predicted protein n=1 Tax=Hordeum vulgare subsp. vulgare TaxID=112509 RepID=F2ED88_HORVV|nr:predicted protein [Hordeum vulgare subsp. vulgare]
MTCTRWRSGLGRAAKGSRRRSRRGDHLPSAPQETRSSIWAAVVFFYRSRLRRRAYLAYFWLQRTAANKN